MGLNKTRQKISKVSTYGINKEPMGLNKNDEMIGK